MDQQAGPSSQNPTVVDPAGSGVPPCVPNPLPLKVQVVLFFLNFTQDAFLLKLLVKFKTGRKNPGMEDDFDCDDAEQYKIITDAKSEFRNNSWEWNQENLGRYIASGMTHGSDLNLATGFAEEASALESFGKPLEPHALEKLAKQELYRFMEKRIMENRIAFPEETKIADQLRMSKLAQPPLTPDELAAHYSAVCSAALGIIVKK